MEIDLFSEIGSTGVPVFEGREADRYISELQGPDGMARLAKVLRGEGAANVVHRAIILTAEQSDWSIVGGADGSDDPDAIDFIKSCLNDMSHDFRDSLRFALSSQAFGFADQEIVYKRRQGPNAEGGLSSKYDDGLVGLRKLAIRRQETISKWALDENGGHQAMIQINPQTGSELPPIPIDKLLHYRGGDDRGSWEGLGWLEPAYKPWHMAQNLEIIMGIGHQRAHVGLPVFAYKRKPSASERQRVKRTARNLIVNEQQYVEYPEDLVDFSLVSVNNGGAGELRAQINQYRWEIMMLGMAHFMRLGTNTAGSHSLAEPFIRLFLSSVDGALTAIASVINRHLIPRLLQANATRFGTITDPPQLTFSSVQALPTELMPFIMDLIQFLQYSTEEDAAWLRALVGMPQSKDRPLAPNAYQPEPVAPDSGGAPGDQPPGETPPPTAEEAAAFSYVMGQWAEEREMLERYGQMPDHNHLEGHRP